MARLKVLKLYSVRNEQSQKNFKKKNQKQIKWQKIKIIQSDEQQKYE